jgi:hypothetical protein
MVRKNIFEILESKYDINNELEKIKSLFYSGLISHSYMDSYLYQKTVTYNYIHMVKDVFYSWKGRGTCTSCANMRQELGIDKIENKSTRTVDEIVVCLEYYDNISRLYVKKVLPELNEYEYQTLPEANVLKSNIDTLLNHLNMEEIYIKKYDAIIIVPKNPAATAVAEISSEDTAMAILMYHHASLKGQLEEKRKLLLTIAREYEPLLNKGIDGFKPYFDNARNMLNNVHLRHNNKEGKDKIEKIAQMPDEELENWYDELYQLLLFCVLIKDNKERKDKMTEFLKGLKEKK